MDSSARRSFHIGRYHCVEALTQGPLGETFRAKVYGVAGLEKQYALKQIDAALRVDPALRARVIEGAKLYASLEHERIAKLTEINDEGENLFLVVELARGIDLPRLTTHLRGRSEVMPVDQAILVAADIAEALELALRPSATAPNGVLHLGLQPSTVAVLGEGEVRVSDFAITGALARPGWADDNANVGLMGYIAPERARGEAGTPLGDVWSTGAILFELATGAPWLFGLNAADLVARRASAPSWDRLPQRPGLRELLARTLSDDPAQRPEHPAALRAALLELLGLELPRARAGLQALAKRALGRALTRTGSFAAVAIPSASFAALTSEPEPKPTPTQAPPQSGPRTILGIATTPRPHADVPPPAAPARAWAPPRMTGSIPIVRTSDDSAPTLTATLQGIGVQQPITSEQDLAVMEMAELPPSGMGEVTVTERSIDAIAFDEGITSPHAKFEQDEKIDALEPEPLQLEDSMLAEGEVTLEAQRVQGGPTARIPSVPTMMGVGSLPRPVLHTPTGTPPLVPPVTPEAERAPLPPMFPPAPAAQLAPSPAEQLAPPSPPPRQPNAITVPTFSTVPTAPTMLAVPAVVPPVEPLAATIPPVTGSATAPTMSAAPGPAMSAQAGSAATQLPAAPRATAVSPDAPRAGFWIAGGLMIVSIVVAAVVVRDRKATHAVVPPSEPPAVHEPAAPPEEKPEPAKPVATTEPANFEPAKPEPAKVEPTKPEVKVEPAKVEPAKVEPAKVEPAKVEPAKVEPAKVEPAKVEPAKPVANVEPAKPVAKVEPAKPEPPPARIAGQLAVQSTPPGASLWIDGELRGTTPLSAPVTAGKHRATLVLSGYRLSHKSYTIEGAGEAAGDTWVATLEPAKLPAELVGDGGLKVRCHTLGELRILVDGSDTGLSCPNDQRISVTPGEHKIGLYSPRTGETKELDGEVEDDVDHSTRIYVRY